MSVSYIHCQCSRVFPGSATLQRGFWSRAGARRSQERALVQDLRNGPLVQAYVLHDTPGPSPGSWPYNVEITAGVAPDAMTRAEAGVTPLCQALAFQGQDADQAAVVLGDIDDVVSIHVEKGWANQCRGPDLQKFAVLVKNLDAVVLAVRHQHTPVLINPDAMW